MLLLFCACCLACTPSDENGAHRRCTEGNHLCSNAVDRSGPHETLPSAGSPRTQNADGDGDGISDSIDNCPAQQNPDQHDRDQDGLGDPCDSQPNTKTFTVERQSLGGPQNVAEGQVVIVQGRGSNGIYTLNSTVMP